MTLTTSAPSLQCQESQVKLELKAFCHHSLDTHHQEHEGGLFQWNG